MPSRQALVDRVLALLREGEAPRWGGCLVIASERKVRVRDLGIDPGVRPALSGAGLAHRGIWMARQGYGFQEILAYYYPNTVAGMPSNSAGGFRFSRAASLSLPLQHAVAKFKLPFKWELWEYLGSQREPPVPCKT